MDGRHSCTCYVCCAIKFERHCCGKEEVCYLEHESWSINDVTGVKWAVKSTPGRMLRSTESQEQGVKREFYLASRIHPEMLFGCYLWVRPSSVGFQMCCPVLQLWVSPSSKQFSPDAVSLLVLIIADLFIHNTEKVGWIPQYLFDGITLHTFWSDGWWLASQLATSCAVLCNILTCGILLDDGVTYSEASCKPQPKTAA